MLRLRALSAALAALLLLTTACGDDDDPTDEPAADDGGDSAGDADDANADIPDPCGLSTLPELEELFGVAFGEGEITEQPEVGQRQCVWAAADGTAKVITVVVGTDAAVEGAMGFTASELFEINRQASEESESITDQDLGLGDQSYRTTTWVYVLDGDTAYTFSTTTGTSDDAIAALKAWATAVVEG